MGKPNRDPDPATEPAKATKATTKGTKAAAQAAANDLLREVITEKVADKIGEKINEKIERQVAKLDKQEQRHGRMQAKAARQAERLDQLAEHLGAWDVWLREQPRGRRPRFTRADIARTAVWIADAEGFDAVSMRRLASELGAGTMTLYHYVRTKDELLTLVTDAVMEELVIDDDELVEGWRAALTQLADRTRQVLHRHPWLLDIADDPAIGPNSVRHFDQALRAVSGLGGTLEDRLDVVALIDEYVFGYCQQERTNLAADTGIDDELGNYVSGLLDTGEYPSLSALADEMGLFEAWARVELHLRDRHRFDRNLQRVLDGVEASLVR